MASLTPQIQTRTADMNIVYGVNPTSGQIIVDIGTMPNGDLKQVSGITKLVQNVTRWLLTPQGSNPLDPTYGNPLFSMLGRPMPSDFSIFVAMVNQAETSFLNRQQQDAAAGYLTQDEMVQEFENTQVGQYFTAAGQLVPGVISISFTIVARSGQTSIVVLPFTLTSG